MAAAVLDAHLLRAFVAFALERNFTRAARLVGLSQPALFERVQKLTEHTGVALYERQGRGLVLTRAGVDLAAFARDELARAAAFMGALHGQEQTTLTLAAGEGSWLYLLAPAVRAFLRDAAARGTELRVLSLGGPAALDAVAAGAATFAVGVFDLVPTGMVAHDIVSTPMMAALSRHHRLARRRTLRLKDLANERLILAPPGQRHRDLIGRAVASAGGGGAPPLEADGWPLMLSFAAANLGVAVVNGICTPPAGVVLRPLSELGKVKYRVVHRRAAAAGVAFHRLLALIAALGDAR